MDEDLMVRLMLTEPTIAGLTADRVGAALQSFAVEPKREMQWIARAVQGALYTSLTPASDAPDRPSNAETRDELTKLAARTSSVWLSLSERSSAADEAIWNFAFRNWDGRGGKEVDGVTIGEPTVYREFAETVARIELLTGMLTQAAAALNAQGPNWRRAEQREQRILRAQCLSPIFEEAFGLEPTVNTWPTARSLGHWPDFYQRIVALAFGEQATPDLEGVLDEARRRDKTHRVIFAAGVIPD